LFVVVDLEAGETVAAVLAMRKVIMDSLIVPTRIRRFDSSILYVLEAHDAVACRARTDAYGYQCPPGSELTNGSN
jgi:hypothetical protein